MNRMPPRLLVATALLGSFALFQGCGKGEAKPLTSQDFVGSWLEVRDDTAMQQNQRVVKVERLSDKLRKLTLNADGTFKIELAEPDGSVADAGKALSGTWKLDEQVFTCEDVKNSLGSKFAGWTLFTVGTLSTEGGATRCTISHTNGDLVMYRKL